MVLCKTEVPGIAGWEFEHVFRMDSDPLDAFLMVGRNGKAAYRANAGSAEQHAQFEEFSKLLDGEPGWHDGKSALSLT